MRHIIEVPIPLSDTAIKLADGLIADAGPGLLGERDEYIGRIDLTIDGMALEGHVLSMDLRYGRLLARVAVEIESTNLRIDRRVMGGLDVAATGASTTTEEDR